MRDPKGKRNQTQTPQPKGGEKDKIVPAKEPLTNKLWLAGILLLTFIVFYPALNNAFTNWDDPMYLIDNPLIKQLNGENIRRIFTEVYFGNYQPLHIFSYAIEYHFYKLDPAGYHTTSVLMHVLVTFLVFRFIKILSGNVNIALLSALLFGIHPLHVESVAWAAERKDLLYAMFFIASLIFYIKYIRSEEKMKYYFFSFFLFVLSILSKAMASSLPPLLILIDYYFGRKLNGKTILEKLPYFAMAIVIGLKAAYTAASTGQVSLQVFSLFERILIACFNLLAYVYKLILPVQLSVFYPYPARVNGNMPFYFYVAPLLIAVLLFLIIRSLKKTKVIFFGAGFFVACLILVLQLFPVGPNIMAERYSYLSSIGFFYVVAYYFHQFTQKKASLKTPAYAMLAGYSLFLCVATYQRCDVWKDSMTLWTNVLDQFPYVGTALNNRGNVYGKELGDLDKAMENFNASILYEPTYENAYANRGIVYCLRGQFDLAIQDFNKAVELKPGYFDALFNRGIAFSQTNQFDKALADFNTLIKTNPEDARLYSHRGWAYVQKQMLNDGLADFNKALSLDPGFAEAYYRRSYALFSLQRYKEAYVDMQQAIALGMNVDPQYMASIKQAADIK